jgi:hypothetical protein
MKVAFSHIFIQAGINFKFSFKLHNFLSKELSELIIPSGKFLRLYGEDYQLIFNISAKKQLAINEIVGPLTSKKNKTAEFSVFLPYTPIMQEVEPNRSALQHLFEGVYEVLGKYEIDISKLRTEQERIIEKIMASPEMFEDN